MIQRFWPLAILPVLVFGCGGGGGTGNPGGGGGGDVTAPTVSSASVTPQSISAAGGAVQIRATVSDPSGISWVRATVTLPNGTSLAPLTMQLVSDSQYQVTYNAPRNDTLTEQRYSIVVQAADNAGNTSAYVATDPLYVLSNIEGPPPPPNL